MAHPRNTPERTPDARPAASRFLSEVSALRERARQEITEGAATAHYDIDPATAVRVLNIALSTELVCVLRYRQHHFQAKGIHAEPVSNETLAHSDDEFGHADKLANRILQLGGTPELDPSAFTAQPHAEYVTCDSLEAMIKENLIAERIAVDSYREMLAFFGDRDPATRGVLEGILAVEGKHADALADSLETG